MGLGLGFGSPICGYHSSNASGLVPDHRVKVRVRLSLTLTLTPTVTLSLTLTLTLARSLIQALALARAGGGERRLVELLPPRGEALRYRRQAPHASRVLGGGARLVIGEVDASVSGHALLPPGWQFRTRAADLHVKILLVQR